jgi:hypothetical protein
MIFPLRSLYVKETHIVALEVFIEIRKIEFAANKSTQFRVSRTYSVLRKNLKIF